MRFTHTDSRDGLVVIGVEDERGRHEITLNSLDTAQLIGSIRASLEEAIGHPAADSMALPGMVRIQYVELERETLLRIYMNHRVSHDYPVQKGTDLADELKRFADRWEARQSARATHQSPDNPSGKH